MEPIKVTREQLYEQVWTIPMTKLAEQYGVSDVALAKTCRRLRVPRPWRGYWAQVAAGAKVKRTPLPKDGGRVEKWTFLQRHDDPIVRSQRVEAPTVHVGEDLRQAHPAISELGLALTNAGADDHGRLTLPGKPEPLFCVSAASHRRALLLLDALARALVARGHDLTTSRDPDGRLHLGLVVSGETIGISVAERLDPKPHVLTAEEEERSRRGSTYGIPKYDYFPSGQFRIALHDTNLGRRSWSDSTQRRLDGQLGRIIVALETEASGRHERRLAEEQRARAAEQRKREQEVERERRRIEEIKVRHLEGLAADLEEMTNEWHRAERLRSFIKVVDATVTVENRTEVYERWLEWATTHVANLDPLTSPARIAKALLPSELAT